MRCHIAAEHRHFPRLNAPDAGDQPEQRRFADAIGPDKSNRRSSSDGKVYAVERNRSAVAMADVIDPHGQRVLNGHPGASVRDRRATSRHLES
jgi:hypothetical protein